MAQNLYSSFFFFLNDPPTTEFYPLPLHDALPISVFRQLRQRRLNLTRFVCAARLDHRLLSVPRPVERKPGMRLRKHRRMTLRFLPTPAAVRRYRSEEHTSELQSQSNLVCRLLLEK